MKVYIQHLNELEHPPKFVDRSRVELNCDFDPRIYANQPIGMFHCPVCGDMVVAGLPHPIRDLQTIIEQQESPL